MGVVGLWDAESTSGTWEGGLARLRVGNKLMEGGGHGDNDHQPKSFQPSFIRRVAACTYQELQVGQPQGLGYSPGALTSGAHTHPGALRGETRRQGLPPLDVNSLQVAFALCLSFPACQVAGSSQLWGVYIHASVFAGLHQASSPSSHPESPG